MAANNRLVWFVEAIGFSKIGEQSFTAAHGVQSVGMTTSFNVETILELGQLEVYENIEDLPDVEVTVEKVLDGYPLIYNLATRGTTGKSLAGRQNGQSIMAMSLFSDVQDSASGRPIAQVNLSGLFVSSLNYTFPVDGQCKESVSLVGNSKQWVLPAATTFSGGFTNNDVPLATTYASGGVQTRKNVIFNYTATTLDTNGQVNATTTNKSTILPRSIAGISASGTNEYVRADLCNCAIQNISVSADLGREQILELGHKTPYFRYVTFPVDVTTEVEIISKSGDWVNALETGPYTNGANTQYETIKVATQDGLFLDMGTRNRLTNISMGGGDTGGGNQTISYTYTNRNSLYVHHDMDVS